MRSKFGEGESSMATATKLDLNNREREQVEQLCTEFDPEHYVPEWMKERGNEADWEAYLRFERHELRSQLEVAVAFGRALERLESYDFRLQLFNSLAEDLTKPGPISNVEGWNRFQELFTIEEHDHLENAMHEACEAACRRALFIDLDPQLVAS